MLLDLIVKLVVFFVVFACVGVSLVIWLNMKQSKDTDRAYETEFDPEGAFTASVHR